MPWIIPSFKKGLVDKASRSKLTDDYKTRCAELTNMYISKDDSVKIRPPAVLEDIDIPVGSSIIDYRILSDNTVVHIREANAEDIANLPSDVKTQLFQPKDNDYVTREGGDLQALETAYSNVVNSTDPANVTTIVEQGSADGTIGSPLLRADDQRIEYRSYILQARDNSHPLLALRRLGQENNGARRSGDILSNFNDGTTDWTLKYKRTRPITYVYVSGVSGTDVQSRLEPNSNSLTLNVDWNNLLTQFELFEDEVFFIFAENYYKIGTGTNIVNVDSQDLLTKSLNNDQLESKLIPTRKQLWNLRDLPIKVLDVKGPGFDYDTKSGTGTEYNGRLISDGLTANEDFRSAGLDTRPSTERSFPPFNADNQTDMLPDFQPELEWIPGSGPYKASTDDGNDYRSKVPMGIYKPKLNPAFENSVAIFNTIEAAAGSQIEHRVPLITSIKTLEEFLPSNPRLLSIIEYLNPCITHYEHVSTPAPQTESHTESYNLFPDLKMTKKGTNFIDWHHPIFSYGSGEDRHYVFAVPNDPQEILSDQTVEKNENLFALGNGKTTGGLGVRIDIQTGNFLENPNDPSTAVYNRFGNFFPSALNTSTTDRQSRAVNSIPKADEVNMGKTVRILYFYYDYTNSAVQNILDDVEYIGAVINDGAELYNCLLSKSTDSYDIEDPDGNKRPFTNVDILNGIRYAKYPRLRVVRGEGPSGSTRYGARAIISPRYAWSFLPYFMPEEIVGIGKRYSINKLGPFAEIKSDTEFPAYSERTGYPLDSVHSLERDGFPFDVRLLSPRETLQFGGEYDTFEHPDYTTQVTAGILITPISFLIGRGILTQGRNLLPIRTFNPTARVKRTFGQNIIANRNTSENIDKATREGRFVEKMITGLEVGPEDNHPTIDRRGGRERGRDERRDIRLYGFKYPISTLRSVIFNPTFLRTKRHTPKQLLEGSAVIDRGAIQLSRRSAIGLEENRNYFANTIQDYLAARPNANEENFLTASGIDLSLTEASEGGNRYQFVTPRGQDDLVRSITNDSQQLVLGLENSIRTLSSFGVAREVIVSNAGTTSDLATESRYILGANKDDIFQLAYYEEAGGFVYNVVNTDLNPGSEFNMVAGLFGRHKLYFFGQEGAREIYALAMGTGRSPKGVSKLEFDFDIHEMFHFTQDKLALRSDDNIYTLDFSKEAFKEDGSPEVYEDDPAGSRTQPAPFMCAIQSLPILEVDGVRPTPFDRMNIIRAAVGTEGFVDFEFSVVNAQGRKLVKKGVSNRKRELEYTSGLTLIEGLHSSGTAYPSIRIEKQTSKYLAISSVILENKNSRGQE